MPVSPKRLTKAQCEAIATQCIAQAAKQYYSFGHPLITDVDTGKRVMVEVKKQITELLLNAEVKYRSVSKGEELPCLP